MAVGPTPNYSDRKVYDVYVTLDGREYFSRRCEKRYLADRAAQDLEDRYKATGGKATVKPVEPEKRGSDNG